MVRPAPQPCAIRVRQPPTPGRHACGSDACTKALLPSQAVGARVEVSSAQNLSPERPDDLGPGVPGDGHGVLLGIAAIEADPLRNDNRQIFRLW